MKKWQRMVLGINRNKSEVRHLLNVLHITGLVHGHNLNGR